MKVRECFLQAVALVQAGEDAREAWVAMNRKNAPWAAVFEGERLLGLVCEADLGEAIRTPEVFVTAGELAGREMPSRRAVRLSPDADLDEALMQMDLAGADVGFVEGTGRPPGALERGRAGSSPAMKENPS